MLSPDRVPARLRAMAHLGTPMAVRVAATLKIADHVAAGLTRAPEIAAAAGANAAALERLLRFLAARGLLCRDETGGYALTELGEALRDDHPAGVRAWLDIEGAGRPELAFIQLLHSIRTGEAAFPRQFGRTLWDDLAASEQRAAEFNASMGSDTASRCERIAGAYDWGSRGHVVDVGGGDGSLLIALLTRYPGLRGTIVDMPSTEASARATLAAADLADRTGFVAGSFLDPLPPGAGAYLLSLVTHNWDDDGVRAILRRCADAARPRGAVYVIESVDVDGAPYPAMDLRMLVYTGGKERTVGELADLGADAGLALAGVHRAGPLAIVELAPAGE
jgi:predicted transcriptional regulator